MAVYRYQPGSLLDEVTIIMNQSGGVRGYVHARADATPEQLQQVQAGLHAQGWKTVAITEAGKPVLEVRGFKKPEVLIGAVRANGWGHEPVAQTAMDSDTRSEKEKWGNATLKLAGVSYLVGDAGYMTYALKKLKMHKDAGQHEDVKTDKIDVVAGIGYAMGSLALGFYGSRDQSQNIIKTANQKVTSYLRQQGGVVEKDSSLGDSQVEPKRSFIGKVDHLLAKYPSEALNSIYTVVGGALLTVGVRNVIHAPTPKARRTELIEVGLGVTTGLSALAGLLIKEKKPVEGEEKRGGVGGVIDWIQEKPLRATGLGFMAATGFHAVGTVRKYQDGDKIARNTIMGRGVFVASNVVSEILLAVSSKGHGNGVKPDESIDESVIAATADYVARQPVVVQEKMIGQLAGYMASPEVLGGNAADISTKLTKAVADIAKNPWSKSSPAAEPDKTGEVVVASSTPQTKVHEISHQQMVTAPERGIAAAG